jgi:hypothetical protein
MTRLFVIYSYFMSVYCGESCVFSGYVSVFLIWVFWVDVVGWWRRCQWLTICNGFLAFSYLLPWYISSTWRLCVCTSNFLKQSLVLEVHRHLFRSCRLPYEVCVPGYPLGNGLDGYVIVIVSLRGTRLALTLRHRFRWPQYHLHSTWSSWKT